MLHTQRQCAEMVVLPALDQDLRRRTLNRRGFADSTFNETQLRFIKRAKARAQKINPSGTVFKRQPVAMEIGMAYADLGQAIMWPDGSPEDRGAFYLGVDMDEGHERLADERLTEVQLHPSQFDTMVATFPHDPASQPEFEDRFRQYQQAFEIVDIGAFSVAMYFDGDGLEKFVNWAHSVLPSGGQLYITAISPFCNLYPGYEPFYLKRRDFLLEPFPGWISDVTHEQMQPFIPNLAQYLEWYPPFFHLLETSVLERVARKAGFTAIETQYLRRLKPERLVYRGSLPGVGEISSIIATKP